MKAWSWKILMLAGLILLFVFLHANSLNAPFERDEGHYSYGSWLMTQGKTPYADTLEQKPPMIFYPYLLSVLINPNAFWPPRLLAALSLALTLFLLKKIVEHEYGERASWVAVWIMLPMATMPYIYALAANTEKFMLLPMVGMLAIYVFNREKSSGWPWFWAAVCGTITILYKQIGLPVVLFVFAVWIVEEWKKTKDFKALFNKFCFAILGALLAFVVLTGYFFARGGFPGFWEGVVEFNRYYAFGEISLQGFTYYLRIFLLAWGALFLLLGWFLIDRPKRWWFYFGLMLVSWLTIFNTILGHDYIMLIPFWAIMVAVSLDSLVEKLVLAFNLPRWGGLLTSIAVFIVVFTMLSPVFYCYLFSPAELVNDVYGENNPFIEAPLAARRVKEMTSSSDYVFIAGTEQEIMYYSKRFSPTRFGGVYGLVLNHPKALAWQKEVISSLKKHPPKVIVAVNSPSSWLIRKSAPRMILGYLQVLVKSRYTLIGGSMRQGSRASWHEPLAPGQAAKCSLLVYKRK